MHISAFTIVRDEELLVTKQIVHLAYLADEVVVIVQPSKDATLSFAKECALCVRNVRVVEHKPESWGWEYSLRKAMEEAKYDWVFGLPADECFSGAPLADLAKFAKSKGHNAVAMMRRHCVALDPCNPDPSQHWFKQEHPEIGRIRLWNKQAIPRDFKFTLHHGPEYCFDRKAVIPPPGQALIIELKPAWYHYKGQLFISNERHPLNDLMRCEQLMLQRDLRLGAAFWERMNG
jgi:hypothetical protein